LLVVAGDHKANLGVQHRHIVRQFVKRTHQVDHAGEENWKHRKCSLLNELTLGFQFFGHIVVTEEVRDVAASVRDVAASVNVDTELVREVAASVRDVAASVREEAA